MNLKSKIAAGLGLGNLPGAQTSIVENGGAVFAVWPVNAWLGVAELELACDAAGVAHAPGASLDDLSRALVSGGHVVLAENAT